MMGIAFLDKVLHKGIATGNFNASNFILNRVVPFNAPHGIKIRSITDKEVVATIPHKRRNFNHLKSIHACAICTVGEFPAGILLISKFSFSKYRLIMSELQAQYHMQARTDLRATAIWPEGLETEAVEKTLEDEDDFTLQLKTVLTDMDDNEVATITTFWQLKSWDKVKLK